jgi:methylenetetrahydrofolate reductase (NADPH)
MKKITDIFAEKERTFSFEFFPPKTQTGMDKLYDVAEAFKLLDPDWYSVTYGAGGSTRELTTEIVDQLQKRFKVPTMHHFSCVGNSRDELAAKIREMKEKDIRNIFALRGDPPVGADSWQPAADGCEYCYQLIELIRRHDHFFSIGVAGFPEGHINCPSKALDSIYLKKKIDSGGDFVITQIFFDNQDYFEYVERIRAVGVAVRIIPGIMVITSYQKLLSFCKGCGATIPQKIHDIFAPLDGNAEATYRAGVEFTVAQCNELLDSDAPGLHFFTLNNLDPVREIMGKIRR